MKLSAEAEAAFWDGAAFAGRFFLRQSPVHEALERLARTLDEEGIAYAIAGAMALNEHGYRRVTEDVDVVLTRDGLVRFKAAHLGRGYVEKFPGSKGVRDSIAGVNIDVLIAGDYPGDGKPKPVAFPDPAAVAIRGEKISVLPLERLIELKLASGMTASHRMKDLADVQELVKARTLPRELGASLDPYVRDKYDEIWLASQHHDD